MIIKLHYLPNVLTFLRLILTPIILVFFAKNEFKWAFYLVMLAGFTDGLDGYLAKRYRWQTALGAFLDPLADKLLLVGLFLAMAYYQLLPSWFVALVIFRDWLIMGGAIAIHCRYHQLVIQPLMLSKINTLLQILLCLFVLAQNAFFPNTSSALYSLRILMIIVTMTTVGSGALYMVTWWRRVTQTQGIV